MTSAEIRQPVREAAPAAPLRPDVAAARAHCGDAIETIAGIMQNEKASAGDRLRAARELLERAWGEAHSGSEAANEPDYNDLISSLGPRDPATPAAL